MIRHQTWSELWAIANPAFKQIKKEADEPANWKATVDGQAVEMKRIRLSALSMNVVFAVDGENVHLGTGFGLKHSEVTINGIAQPGARVVFSIKSQPLKGKPVIAVFEIKGLTLAGKERRIRFDFPK